MAATNPEIFEREVARPIAENIADALEITTSFPHRVELAQINDDDTITAVIVADVPGANQRLCIHITTENAYFGAAKK